MLQNPALKAEFFTSIDSALIFQKERFLDFLKLRILDSSYTKFANKIGLSINSDLLKNALLKGQAKIALNFPYKDCVLKGAQSKDSDKSDEIFFNEILASDEIDILFKPKALQRFELVSVDSNKSKDFESIKSALQNRRSIFDEKSGLCSHERGNKTKASIDEASGKLHDLSQKDKPSTPNLLIKGNNLLALHTLKSRRDIYGQVKIIYIDPPYNTGNDSFNYNDRFNHSAWLVFMKNRLEIAREFLREDGVIFIQCDDNEQAYLKVLCDEIFGRENFEITITCKVKSPSGLGSGVKPFFDCTEFILVYSKNKNLKSRFRILKEDVSIVCESNDKTTDNYNKVLEYVDFSNKENAFDFGENIYRTKNFKISNATKNAKFYYENYDKIFRLSPSNFSSKLPNDDYLYFNDKGGLFYKCNDLAFLKQVSRLDKETKKIYKQEWQSNLILGNMWQGLQKEGQVTLKNGKKPEALLRRIIEISTKEGDLVMDFFAGSGTTCAVAHKMNRRWIGIEQMDYVEGITKERLIKVINGEQGGISKAVGWNPLSPSLAEGDKGGGFSSQANATSCHSHGSEAPEKSTNHNDNLDSSLRATHSAQNDKQRVDSTHAKAPSATFLQFVEGELPKNEFIYCELMPLNAIYKDKIAKSSSDGELARIYDELQTKAFIDYRVDIKEMLKDRDFEALPLADKKQILYEILDSNMDYVAYSDMQDSSFCVDKEVQELNRAFFKGGENG